MSADTANAELLPPAAPRAVRQQDSLALGAIAAISLSHCLNDLIQSLVPAIYPILKESYALDFAQIGLITLTFQFTASLLQPLVGMYSDRRPQPFSLAVGMGFTLAGLVLLAYAGSFWAILFAAALIGTGSAIFHPEASRIARAASGGRHGLAQSVFQVGGNFGQAVGPLLAAFIVVPRGQASVVWFSAVALLAIAILTAVGRWYRRHLAAAASRPRPSAPHHGLSGRRVAWAMAILVALVFSKNFYSASLTSYYTFYLIHRFGVPVQTAQIYLFVFLGSVALGTILGGPIGDRIGRKLVIWVSILGVLPFALALPYVDLTWTVILTIPIGFIMASSFPAIVVFAQELLPGRIGVVSGLFFGLSFGMGGLGAAVFGELADRTSIEFVYQVSALLPAIGVVAILLPNLRRRGVT
ncbi:MFS transporter [Enterovirga aerilata]|uniref:MFS transporter n=1 Tax=Enterovirga aerilata TaxID=2730920 RepID=A0A849I6V6_9HYPH|nr:MFS transporter [Enterovirga sp. DB1703]NNM71767.1 MFS transporter [Enterovirga sp. DB1703]